MTFWLASSCTGFDHLAPIGSRSSRRPCLGRSLNYGYIYLKHHKDPKTFCHLVSDRLNVITVLADVVGVLADAVPRLPGVRVVVEAAAVEVVARTSVLPMTPRERYVGSKRVIDQRVLEQRRKDERDANALMGMSKNPHWNFITICWNISLGFLLLRSTHLDIAIKGQSCPCQ